MIMIIYGGGGGGGDSGGGLVGGLWCRSLLSLLLDRRTLGRWPVFGPPLVSKVFRVAPPGSSNSSSRKPTHSLYVPSVSLSCGLPQPTEHSSDQHICLLGVLVVAAMM